VIYAFRPRIVDTSCYQHKAFIHSDNSAVYWKVDCRFAVQEVRQFFGTRRFSVRCLLEPLIYISFSVRCLLEPLIYISFSVRCLLEPLIYISFSVRCLLEPLIYISSRIIHNLVPCWFHIHFKIPSCIREVPQDGPCVSFFRLLWLCLLPPCIPCHRAWFE
jgi:hypothetical protein